jgi:hypothetical protein
MLEIFIPTWIKNQKIQINNISDVFLDVLKNNFSEAEVNKFESTFFSGIKINLENFDENLIFLCNWEFWENYFLNYDFTKKINTEIFWIKIIWENKIWENIQKIMLNIAEITWILNSDNLLTNSKKEEILVKIRNSFFALSGVIFLLYFLKEKADENLVDLENYSWKIEYEAQASLLKETSITKSIELKANIDKLEGKIEMFISVINNFIK